MNRSDLRGTTLCTMGLSAIASTLASCTLLWLGFVAGSSQTQSPDLDASLIQRIDAFVDTERRGSGIPGIALAILTEGRPTHIRGFGHDGRGRPITGDTPFPIGSLTKSFTALMVRQAIDVGRLDVDAPVQRYLPWFRVADVKASGSITLRHLLNQTSGFSRADGIAPLLQGSTSTIKELAHGLRDVSLNRSVGVVNQLLGQQVVQGPTLQSAYLRLIGAAAFPVIGIALLAWMVTRSRAVRWSLLMMLLAIAMVIILLQRGLNFAMLSAFAPDLTVVLGVILGLLCLPASVRVLAWARGSYLRKDLADNR
jgi:hypothetical protein